jgi:hypothetical protein
MKQPSSARRLINNELVARAVNKKSLKALRHHVPNDEQTGLKILFNCECASDDCEERIALTLDEYNQLHENAAQFVIVKEHLEPSVEKVHASNETISVVEKFALPKESS